MKLEQFRLDVADGIATVTFDRPPVNAQNRQTREEIVRVFDAISDRDDVRVAPQIISRGNDRVDLVTFAKRIQRRKGEAGFGP